MKTKALICLFSFILFFNIFTYSGFAENNGSSLTAPQNVKVIDTTVNSITIAWDVVENANYYKIYRAISKNGNFEYVSTTYSTSYKDAYLSTNKTYYYKVQAYSYLGRYSDYSNIVSASISFDAPKNLHVSGKTSAKLTWDEVENAFYYEVYRSTSENGEYKYIGKAYSETYEDKTISTKQTYYYKVRAYSSSVGYSDYSNIVSISIDFEKPNNLKVLSTSYSSVTLSWDKVEDANYYEIYRATSENGDFKYVDRTYDHSYEDTGLPANQTYYYKVRANYNNSIYSDFSNIVNATVDFETPKNLKISSKSYDRISLSWNKVEGADEYVIYRATSKNGTYKKIDETYENYYKDEEIVPNKTYYYKVQAYCFDNTSYSDYSNIVSASASLVPPKDLKVGSKTDTSVKLTWKKEAEADGYEVWVATSKNGKYKKIATVESNSYTHKNLKPNTYYYKVRAYVEYPEVYSTYTNITSTTISLMKPSGTKISAKTPTALTLSWNKVNHAEGYEIWMATKKKGTYKKIGTTTKTKFTHSKLEINKTYYYKVRAYTNKKTNYSSYGSVISGRPTITAPTSLKTSGTNSSIKLTWKAVSGASKYKIYRSTSKNGTFKLIKTTSKTSYTDQKVKKGKTYYYKLIASGKVKKKTYNSPFSATIKGTAKKIYLKPNINVFTPDIIDYTNVVLIYIENNGSKPLKIASTGYLIDDNYTTFDRSLHLIDTKTAKDKKSLQIKGKGTAYVAYRVNGYSTWYDDKSTIIFYFYYDGKKYTGYVSNYYGFYYK